MAGRPSFHFRVLGPPGCAGVLAGSFWAVGNFLITTAVELGGNAVRDEHPSVCVVSARILTDLPCTGACR